MPEYRTPLPAMLAATLQSGLNAALSLDDDSEARLARIEDRVLKLELEGAGIDLFFSGTPHGIRVSLESPREEPVEPNDPPQVDTTISGTPAALLTMAAAESGEGWSGPKARVSIAGDATLARDFERLFSRLDPDVEAALSSILGDVAGHQLAFGLKQGAGHLRRFAEEARNVLGEVLKDGSRGNQSGPLVGSAETSAFADGVDALRDAVDRLEAKISRHEARTAADGSDAS